MKHLETSSFVPFIAFEKSKYFVICSVFRVRLIRFNLGGVNIGAFVVCTGDSNVQSNNTLIGSCSFLDMGTLNATENSFLSFEILIRRIILDLLISFGISL